MEQCELQRHCWNECRDRLKEYGMRRKGEGMEEQQVFDNVICKTREYLRQENI